MECTGTMIELFNRYETSRLVVQYLVDENKQCGMVIYPRGQKIACVKEIALDSLVHVFLEGDAYAAGFSNGLSMRNATTTASLKLVDQNYLPEKRMVDTTLSTGNGVLVIHHCILEDTAVSCSVTVKNERVSRIHIEMLTSFSINTAIFGKVDNEKTIIHRLRSFWSSENRMISQSLAALDMEESWSGYGMRSIRFGALGSLPVRQYYPFAAIEMPEGFTWAAALDAPCTWQLEISRQLPNELCLSGGTGDYEFGHYRKILEIGETYQTPTAYLTAVLGGADDTLRIFNRIFDKNIEYIPDSERNLPIIYNEFCYTWGNPCADKIREVASKIRDWGIGYFVIDAGWYQNDSGDWGNNLGDWDVSARLFPNGIREVSEYIRECGMIPGIWFEIETVGKGSHAAEEKQDWLLRRNNKVIWSGNRSFWDFRQKKVLAYLEEKVDAFLISNGFSYLKVDYNESIGVGCDHRDSLGVGLQENIQLVQNYLRKLRQLMPELVLEVCASGGHRNEPSFLKISSMNSFSDAHECLSIPIIAANVGMTVPARQNQIWCVIRTEDDSQRIRYSLAATFIGRMCLSGNLCELQPWQDALVKEGISFYEAIKPVIWNGDQYIYRNIGEEYNSPKGSQIIIRKNAHYCLAVAHAFESPVTICAPIDEKYRIRKTFGGDCMKVVKGQIIFTPVNDFTASAILLEIALE